MIGFSLVMSVYAKENPQFLAQCIKSVLAQTVIPDEWIIVKDGILPQELDEVLGGIRYPNCLNIIELPENVTQGPARAEGIKAARHEWVAIMDSDDICVPDRFEKQIGLISESPELGLIGGQIGEFSDDPDHITATRAVPTDHENILDFVKMRNPFNSMTVMFKREAAMQAGNYRYFPQFEDYDLWVRMIHGGVACANLPDILVKARVGGGMYGRRRGVSYIRSEWRMQKQLKTLGMINFAKFMRNCALRMPIRLLPEKLMVKAYMAFARK